MMHRRHGLSTFAALLVLCASATAWSQADDEADAEAPATEAADDAAPASPMDEIIVTGEKPGDRRDLDAEFEAQIRERLIEEMDTMRREQEEFAWRSGTRIDNSSRISFGYRPQDSERDSRDDSLTRLPMENNRPATIFRFEF